MTHRPLYLALAFLVCALLLAACSVAGSRGNGSDEAVPTDSIALDSLAAAGEEPAKERVGDAAMVWLKGAVRSVTVGRSEGELRNGQYEPTAVADSSLYAEFDATGRITHDPLGNRYIYDRSGRFTAGNHAYTTLTRDDAGRIVTYCDEEPDTDSESNFSLTFSYDEQGRLTELVHSGWTEVYTTSFTYDGHGQLAMKTSEGSFEGGGSFTLSLQYDYRRFDPQGNWTLRLVVSNFEERDTEDNPVENEENVYFEHRSIVYEP